MLKTISPFNLGDVRLIKCDNEILAQGYTPDGWHNFRFFRTTRQTLTNCIAELCAAGYAYMGREPLVFYYRQAGIDCE